MGGEQETGSDCCRKGNFQGVCSKNDDECHDEKAKRADGIDGKGGVCREEACAAEVEEAVEAGHGFGKDEDSGLSRGTHMRGDGGFTQQVEPLCCSTDTGDEETEGSDTNGCRKEAEQQADCAACGKKDDQKEEQRRDELELKEGECEEQAGRSIAAGVKTSPDKAKQKKKDDVVLPLNDGKQHGKSDEEECRPRNFGEDGIGDCWSESIAEGEDDEVEGDEGEIGRDVGKQRERNVEKRLVGGVIEWNTSRSAGYDSVLDRVLYGETKELGGVVAEKKPRSVERAEVIHASRIPQGNNCRNDDDEGKAEPGEDGTRCEAMDRRCAGGVGRD